MEMNWFLIDSIPANSISRKMILENWFNLEDPNGTLIRDFKWMVSEPNITGIEDEGPKLNRDHRRGIKVGLLKPQCLVRFCLWFDSLRQALIIEIKSALAFWLQAIAFWQDYDFSLYILRLIFWPAAQRARNAWCFGAIHLDLGAHDSRAWVRADLSNAIHIDSPIFFFFHKRFPLLYYKA
jgi:hypothetical protein